MRFRTSQEVPLSPDRVGVLVTRGKQYSKRQMTQIHEHLTRMALTPVDLDWKAALDGRFLGELETLDWAVVDIGSDACATGLPAFLHGRFIPQMRLIAGPPDVRSPLENTLLAAFDVGYPKDIVRWHNSKSLDRELVQRLTTLYEPPKYVGTSAQAREYFAGASLRKEAVFLSYSGDDREFAARLSQALRKRFQQVFDYRDQGHSIVPGRRWIEEIFDKLAASGIGVPLLSSTYFKSGNCTHEARQMMSLADAGELTLIPTKMQEGALDLPSWMQDLQYVRGWEYPSPETLAAKILAAYDAKAPRTRPRGSAEPSNRSRSR